jgi:predicted dehydrogenase
MRVGILGCGHVSSQYFEGLRRFGDLIEVVACADADHARATDQARAHAVGRVLTPEQLLSDSEVELIVNLTPPTAHYEVSAAAIAAGKHLYSEKPLAGDLEQAAKLVEAAKSAGVRLGCAPDTFMGGGLQTARKLIDDGWIGRPLSAVACVSEPGYEHFHPNIDFFYGPGGGPILDLGPYYVTALVNIFGPARRVSGCTRATFPQRTIRAGKRAGEKVAVHVPTHVTGVIEFVSGAMTTLLASWDIWTTTLPYIQVYGSAGSISLPNPDEFGGQSLLRVADEQELAEPPHPPGELPWTPVPLRYPETFGRGAGVADIAGALSEDRPHRASGDLALHVLEVLLAFQRSSEQGIHVEIEHQCERPQAMDLSSAGQELA